MEIAWQYEHESNGFGYRYEWSPYVDNMLRVEVSYTNQSQRSVAATAAAFARRKADGRKITRISSGGSHNPNGPDTLQVCYHVDSI